MSAMSELSAEREEALNEARWEYQEAFDAYVDLLSKYPIGQRTLDQMDEISKAEWRCMKTKECWEHARDNRYKVTNAKI